MSSSIDIPGVTNLLIKDLILLRDWKRFSDALGTPAAFLFNHSSNAYELFSSILREWSERTGSSANIQALIRILHSLEFKLVAEQLQANQAALTTQRQGPTPLPISQISATEEMDFASLLNSFTVDGRKLGNFLTQTTTFGDMKLLTLNLPDGSMANLTVQDTVRKSGCQKWEASGLYKGQSINTVSSHSAGAAVIEILQFFGIGN